MPRDLLTLRDLNRATLARQMLLERSGVSVIEATERLVALQAQIPRPPFIGLWARLARLERGEVTAALLEKRLVRGTSLRGTLHVMTAADFRRFRGALQPSLDRGLKIVGARLDGADLPPVLALARQVFNQPRTFDALRDELTRAFPGADVRALAYAARMQVPLLQVPTTAAWAYPAHADFITADAWLGKPKKTAAGTVDELILRYLAAYGPSTIADAQAWSGVPSLKPVFEALRPQLISFRGERGGEIFDLPQAPRPGADVPAPVRFLPDWDNVIGGRADGRIVPAAYRSAVYQPGLRVLATVLVDGLVAATWKIERTKAAATLKVSLLGTIGARARREIQAEGESLLGFAEPDAATTAVAIE